jgi:hypothetical protein
MTPNPRNENAGVIGPFIERIMERLAKVPSPIHLRWNDSRARVRQRRFVTAGVTPPWVTGASSVLLFTVVTLFGDLIVLMGTGYRLPSQALFGMCVALPLAEPWLFAFTMTYRWPLLARESLLPASRSEFAFETGRAFFRDLLESWVICTSTAMAIAFAWSPENFLSKIGEISLMIAYAAAALIFVFGISIWFMRFRHRWVSFLGLMVCLPVMVTIPVLMTFRLGQASTLYFDRAIPTVWIAGLCLTGALLMLDAYHRWCRTELD